MIGSALSEISTFVRFYPAPSAILVTRVSDMMVGAVNLIKQKQKIPSSLPPHSMFLTEVTLMPSLLSHNLSSSKLPDKVTQSTLDTKLCLVNSTTHINQCRFNNLDRYQTASSRCRQVGREKSKRLFRTG